jgi:Na+/H+ antiporter 1
VVKRIQPPIFQRFFRTETVGGSVLLLFAIAALVLANSPLAKAYERFWRIPLTVGIVDHSLSLTLHQWINDGLRAVFFLLVARDQTRAARRRTGISAQGHPSDRLHDRWHDRARCGLLDSKPERSWCARVGHSDGDGHCFCVGRAHPDRAARPDRGKSYS